LSGGFPTFAKATAGWPTDLQSAVADFRLAKAEIDTITINFNGSFGWLPKELIICYD
jgi:hypothetical protein